MKKILIWALFLFPVGAFAMTFVVNSLDTTSSPGFVVANVTGSSLGSNGVTISNMQNVFIPLPATVSAAKTAIVSAFSDQLNKERSLTATPTPAVSVPTFTVN